MLVFIASDELLDECKHARFFTAERVSRSSGGFARFLLDEIETAVG